MNERYRVTVKLLRNRRLIYHVFADNADVAERLVTEYVKLKYNTEYIVSVGAISFPASVTMSSVRIIPIRASV